MNKKARELRNYEEKKKKRKRFSRRTNERTLTTGKYRVKVMEEEKAIGKERTNSYERKINAEMRKT